MSMRIALTMRLAFAFAPWFGHAQDVIANWECRNPNLSVSLVPAGNFEWRCVPCLTEFVRAREIRELEALKA